MLDRSTMIHSKHEQAAWVSPSISSNRRSATSPPDERLDYLTEYLVTVAEGIADRAGNPIETALSSFTTEEPDVEPPRVTAVGPADGATGVAVCGAVLEAGSPTRVAEGLLLALQVASSGG